MRKHLYVDGVDLAAFGVYISGSGTFGAPARKLDVSDIPGRNGAILGIDKSYANINVTYPCFIYASFDTNIAALRAFLLSRAGYVKISDDYHAGEYRMGIYEGPLNPSVLKKNDAGTFNLVFNCMPQRFLDSGETVITGLKEGGSVTNPTSFPSLPIIRVKAINNGPFTVNGVTLTISAFSVSVYKNITIDCEDMECYDTDDGTPYNDHLTTADFRFPELSPGANAITVGDIAWGVSGDITIEPRWWTL